MTYDEALKKKESMPEYVTILNTICLVMIVPLRPDDTQKYFDRITDWTKIKDFDTELFAITNQFRVVACTGGSNSIVHKTFPS